MRPDEGKPYYTAYDKRYRSVYQQGADNYIFLPAAEEIREIVIKYIEQFELAGKKVVEFGCGEGWAGLEFARLGCIYYGYDIVPSALEKATGLLSEYANATTHLCDVVLEDFPDETFDAGIDIACLHMLITDVDRKKYLGNVYKCLKQQAPMYFIHEGCRDDIYDGEITSYEQWLELTGEDVDTPEKRREALKDGEQITVMIPRIAARPRPEKSYSEELTAAGFKIIRFETNDKWGNCNFLVRKP